MSIFQRQDAPVYDKQTVKPASPPIPWADAGQAVMIYKVLCEIRDAIVRAEPVEFLPARYTLTAGQGMTLNLNVLPEYWFIDVDPTSGAGALLEVHQGGSPSYPWIILYPGDDAKFPSKGQGLYLLNSSAATVYFTVTPLKHSTNAFVR